MPSTLSFSGGELLSIPGAWASRWWLHTTRTSPPTPASTGSGSSTAPLAGTPGSCTTRPPSTSAPQQATLRYLAGEGVERLHLWPQGVDAGRFHPDKFSKDWRVRLTNGHPAEQLLLYVGRLGHEKDIGNLKVVLGEVPGVRLALVGDGPARRDLEQEFANTPTVFTGVLQGEELASAFASADVFLFPSTTETLGIAMIEALASGLPVIAAKAGAAGEVVDEGETGLLYDPSSDEVSSPPSEGLPRRMACGHGWDVTPAPPRRGEIGEFDAYIARILPTGAGGEMSEAKAKLKSGGKRFSKFSLVGISNAAIDIGVLNLFLWLAPTREVTLCLLSTTALRSFSPT